MELFIAGGCGEHGRNCFYVEQNGAAFLVDCGLLAVAEDDLPRLPFSLNHIQTLESLCPCKGFSSVPELPGLQVTWGRSGHCAGSVWQRFEWNGKSILFSGDYAEHSPFYPCDPLRSQTTDEYCTKNVISGMEVEVHNFGEQLLDNGFLNL